MFENISGQASVTSLLTSAVASEKIGHAYIFNSEDTEISLAIAKDFAKTIMCTGRAVGSTKACGCCESCRLLSAGTNFDYVEAGREEDKNVVSVGTLRQVVSEAAMAPEYSRRRVFVIRDAELMNSQAQNAFLKMAEEPPEFVTFIMLSANNSTIIDTLKSRSVTVNFGENISVEINTNDPALLEIKAGIASALESMARGDVHSASILRKIMAQSEKAKETEVKDEDDEDENAEIDDAKPKKAVKTKDEGPLKDKRFVRTFVYTTMATFLRDVMVTARYGTAAGLINVGLEAQVRKCAGTLGYHKAMRALNSVNEAWTRIGRGVNERLVADNLVIELVEATRK